MPYITGILNSCLPRGPTTGKRKQEDRAGGAPHHPYFPPTQLDELVLDGMEHEQLWQQLELRTSKLARVLDNVMTHTGAGSDEDEDEEDDEESDDTMDVSHDDAEMNDSDSWEDESESEASDEGFAGASDFSDMEDSAMYYEPLRSEEEQRRRNEAKAREDMLQMYDVSDPAFLEAMMAPGDNEDPDDEDEEEENEEADDVAPSSSKPRHPTLDDDFFSIDEFNRMTAAEERRSQTSKANLSGEDDDVDFDDELDLFAPIDDEDDSDAEEGMSAADIHYADFFDPVPKASNRASSAASKRTPAASKKRASPPASPPPRASMVRFHDQVRVRPIKRAKPREAMGLLMGEEDEGEGEDSDEDEDEEDEVEEDDEEDEDGDEDENDDDSEEDEEDEADEEEDDDDDDDAMEEDAHGSDGEFDGMDDDDADPDASDEDARADATAQRVAQDLFADEPEDAPTSLSTHERHLAELAEEIARYEDENVQKRDWTLMGEASTRERPSNSLLEETLEFERTAKAAPIQTQEHLESIEAMIKRRILEKNYDDVIRQRDLEPLPFAASNMLDLSDAKSQKSLAELYEDEYQASRGKEAGEDAPLSEAEAKLRNDHASITADMESLFNKLDALSNAHYTPKAPKAAIQTVSNTASIAMESALPSTMSTGTMLAPEEVYDAPKHSVAMTGDKSEMSHAEKQRLHHQLRHEKKQRNARIQQLEAAIERQRGPRRRDDKAEKEKALKSLVGNKGVTVVGKDSKRRSVKDSVQDRKSGGKPPAPPSSGSRFKL